MKIRNEIDLIREFLMQTQDKDGIMPHRLQCKTGISHTLYKKYLPWLVKKDFICKKEEGRHKIYFITEKGSSLLEDINEIIKKMK